MTVYEPSFRRSLQRSIDVPTAWDGVEQAIPAIIEDFGVRTDVALEFGVDYGFSTVALANYFNVVHGVDTFMGDINAGDRGPNGIWDQVVETLRPWPNIYLHRHRFQDWILFDENRYDMIHVDIVHNFEETYQCGRWSVDHAPIVIFHDTIAFPEVMRAVTAIADETGAEFHQWNYKHGLGILVRR